MSPVLPGIAGNHILLRRCSPVVDTRAAHGFHGAPVTVRGIWSQSGPKADEGFVLWDLSSGTRERVESSVYAGLLALDLGDATGRAHAAWWLLRKWGKTEADLPGCSLAVLGRGWQLITGAWGKWVLPDGPHEDATPGISNIVVCASISDLDPADPRLLPDGSRWVDAEALRRVVLHVAGVTQ